MVRHTRVVYGKVHDGDTETSPSDTLAKKIYDLISGATTIHSVSVERFGRLAFAVVVYDD